MSVFELKIISILRQNTERYSYNSGFLKRFQKLKQCHRPVCILHNISKNYERCIYEQMSNYFGNIFSESQCGFRTGIQCATLSSNHIKKMELKNFCMLLTDISKVFDCVPHDLSISKVNVYGFSSSASKLTHYCPSCRKHRTKINISYSL